ncbi:unnamed protein product, partial [marine sediment metagenome]
VGYPDMLTGSQLNESVSFFNLTPDNVILTVLKKAEDSSGYVVRFYEASDTDISVRLAFNFPKSIGLMHRSNLLEDNTESLPVSNNALSMNILGFAIETVKFSFSGNQPPSAVAAPIRPTERNR